MTIQGTSASAREPAWRGLGRLLFSLALAAGLWLPVVHLFFRPSSASLPAATGLTHEAKALAAAHLAIWADPELRDRELDRMRGRNPEWDFMSRTFLVLALANMAERDPAYRATAETVLDAILEQTLAVERDRGFAHFLLDYGRKGGWQVQPPGSLFVDGEIALMLGVRRLLSEKAAYRPLLAERIERIERRLEASPVLCGESYPDECWLFCNTVALAAMRIADRLDGTDHGPLLAEWVRRAKAKLTDPATGLLISAFGIDGRPAPCGEQPEGSTIWMAAHMLQIVDGEFARDQYDRARRELGRSALGFGYSREWPAGARGSMDIDSGPVLPLLGASASASGLAILAAAAFDDAGFLLRLLTSLDLAGFPVEREGKLSYLGGNQVGDAVLLYALTEGPLWAKVRGEKP